MISEQQCGFEKEIELIFMQITVAYRKEMNEDRLGRKKDSDKMA